jgi:outer membrane protein OmpA-like peptidoglycan-associated protein
VRSHKVVAAAVLSITLAGCVAPATRPSAPIVLDGQNFEYSISDRISIQLIQVFDDGSKTYLQFTHPPTEPLIIEDPLDSKPLAFLGSGPYLIVPGVYDRLKILVGTHSALVRNEAPNAKVASAAASASDAGIVAGTGMPQALQPEAPPNAPVPLAAVALQAHFAELRSELTQAHAAGRASRVSIGTGGVSLRVIIRFGAHSSAVDIDEELLQALGSSALAAKHIYLHVSTDTDALTGPSADLAAARAVAVEHLLIARGVEAQKIRIFYRTVDGDGSGNVKQDGKVAARRVEIQLIKG